MSGQEGIEAYPLAWPAGWPRTPPGKIERAKFGSRVKHATYSWTTTQRLTNYAARERLLDELGRLGAQGLVLSTNIPTRQDGLPYSNAKEPRDHGVAVYFRLKGEPRVLACDRWDRVADNMAALAAHIDAMRGQGRWGVGSLDQAFAGYKALTAVGARKPWHEVLGVQEHDPTGVVELRIKTLQREHHPDRGGNGSQMAEVNAAADEFRRERDIA